VSNVDTVIVEASRIHRARLTSALLFGPGQSRRRLNTNIGRLVGSLMVGALGCAGCAGFSFVKANIGSLTGTLPVVSASATPGATR
jgi:hypothetical protein